MPKGKKRKLREMTDEEVMAKLFSRRVVTRLKSEANPDELEEKKAIRED